MATGLLLKSYNTRFTPLTSLKILSLIFPNKEYGISSMEAVTASTLLIARMTTGHSNVLLPSLMPVDLIGGTMVKYCHTF